MELAPSLIACGCIVLIRLSPDILDLQEFRRLAPALLLQLIPALEPSILAASIIKASLYDLKSDVSRYIAEPPKSIGMTLSSLAPVELRLPYLSIINISLY